MGALCYYGPWSTVAAQSVALPCFYTHVKHLVGNSLRINVETQTCHYNSSYKPLLHTSYFDQWKIKHGVMYREGRVVCVSVYARSVSICDYQVGIQRIHFSTLNQLWRLGLNKLHFKGVSTSVRDRGPAYERPTLCPDLWTWTLQLWCSTQWHPSLLWCPHCHRVLWK